VPIVLRSSKPTKSVRHSLYISYNSGSGRPADNPCAFYSGALPDQQMVKRKRDSIPALVLEVIAQVYELSGHRTQPWYVDRAALDLGHASDSIDSSIYYAEVSGWLVGAGEPPQSVAITADGVRLLEECGVI
jgi:hypothetical protein